MTLAASLAGPASLDRGTRRIGIGIAISLALHALFLLVYRNTEFRTMDTGPTEPTSIEVTLAPPPPPPPEPPMARATPSAPGTPVAPRPNRPAPPKAVIAVPEHPTAEPAPFVVQQEETPEPAPKFDMDAARAVARANANMRDPAKEGTALAQFPEPPLQTESKLARGIAAAKRPDCKDGIPGGLLAPVYLLMKKKDTGCKW